MFTSRLKSKQLRLHRILYMQGRHVNRPIKPYRPYKPTLPTVKLKCVPLPESNQSHQQLLAMRLRGGDLGNIFLPQHFPKLQHPALSISLTTPWPPTASPQYGISSDNPSAILEILNAAGPKSKMCGSCSTARRSAYSPSISTNWIRK
jgi:hypothetical protein